MAEEKAAEGRVTRSEEGRLGEEDGGGAALHCRVGVAVRVYKWEEACLSGNVTSRARASSNLEQPFPSLQPLD